MPSVAQLVSSMKELDAKSKAAPDLLHVVMFKAEWCGPCKVIYPKVEELSDNYPSVHFSKLNIDDEERSDIAEFFAQIGRAHV